MRHVKNYIKLGRVQWLTPALQHFGRPRQVDHLRSGIRNQSGQHGETLSLLKIHKISQAWRMPVIPATWEAEAGEMLEPRRQRLQSLFISKVEIKTTIPCYTFEMEKLERSDNIKCE